MLEYIKVTIGQSSHRGKFENWVDLDNRLRIASPHEQLDALFKTVDTAKQDNSQFVVFPELFLPREYLQKHVKAICQTNHFIMIGGLEYGPLGTHYGDKTTPLKNEAFIAIPHSLQWDKKSNQTYNKKSAHCTLLTTTKILPAEEEEGFIHSHGYTFENGNKILLFQSSIVGNWAVLICADFLNLPIHVLLQSNIHTIFVIAYNKDVNGYTSIADTIQRVSMCNVVICNMGNYGSSLAFSPYRIDYKRNAMKIIGNQIDAAITIKLPLSKLDQAQRGIKVKDKGEQVFIKRPPDFGRFQIIKTWD